MSGPVGLLPHPDVLDTAEEIGRAAISYARIGLYVFPLHVPVSFGRKGTGSGAAVCSCGGKFRGSRYEPCARQAQHGIIDPVRGMTGGIHGASNDPELTARRWAHWAPAGIGCDTRRSGLLVIDVDDASARQRLRQLVAEHGSLMGAVALTGRGEHHWLALPPGMYRDGRLGSLELKCNTCVTLPPSWHPSGARYRWILRDPLVEGGFPAAPSWTVDLVARPTNSPEFARAPSGNGTFRFSAKGHGTGPALRRLGRLVSAVEEAEHGQHHDALNLAWFAAGSFSANGWLDPEWAEHDVLVPLTHQCGAKHVHNLSGFRSALSAGLRDPAWARR